MYTKNMLKELFIKDFILIESLHLNFEKGFSVLTGETGAGKSILLDALSLCLGKRSDVSCVRKNTTQACISAKFHLEKSHGVFHLLSDLGLISQDEPENVELRRQISEKNSRAFINDIPIGLSTLKVIGEQLFEIHGQFDHLFDIKTHEKLFDLYIQEKDFNKDLDVVKDLYYQKKKIEKQLNTLFLEEREQKQSQLLQQNILNDLLPLNIEQDEESLLLEERLKIEDLGKLSYTIEETMTLLDSNDFVKGLRHNITQLEKRGSDILIPLLVPLKRMESDLLETSAQAEDLFLKTKDSMIRLQEIDERLYILRAFAKKYMVETTALFALLENAQKNVNRNFTDEIQDLKNELDILNAHYQAVAQTLSNVRKKYALFLQKDIENAFKYLKLPHARFCVDIKQLPLDQAKINGWDAIEFLIATNKEQDFSNIKKSASGGELARVMLALKSILSSKSNITTLIFDEIETGVGGAVATAIGKRLKELSEDIQIISISHSPQVASFANQHYLVEKTSHDTHTKTHVKQLNDGDKTTEIARMLSGSSLTEGAISAAKDLLQNTH